jgi:DnaJ family protein C protein 28
VFGKRDNEKSGEKPIPFFDINHTAPQHRQYLSNEGFGFGSPAQRQSQHQKYRALKASENVTQHTIDKLSKEHEKENQLATVDREKGRRARRQATKNTLERLAEDLIAESMAKGDFDNLSGAGKPLPERVIYNPYEDFTTHKMNQILADGGFAPEWIMLKKDIDKMIENLGQDLDKHCLRYLKKANNANEAECKRAWTQICDQTFRDNEIILINKTIDNYNLRVPMMKSQKFHINLDRELEKVWKRHWVNHFQQITADNNRLLAELNKKKNTVVTEEGNNNGLLERVINFVSNKLGS